MTLQLPGSEKDISHPTNHVVAGQKVNRDKHFVPYPASKTLAETAGHGITA
jgi:hypothetical protein